MSMSLLPETSNNTGVFIQWYQKRHVEDYKAWSLITSPAGGETDDQFKQRVLKDGARKFQSAMWQVHDSMSSTPSWSSLTEAEQKLLMQATQLFLLRAHRIRGIDVVASAETAQVDSRLTRLCGALSSSLELDHWKFEPRIKESISANDASFATLCQAAEALVSMVRGDTVQVAGMQHAVSSRDRKQVQDFCTSDKQDPVYILHTFQDFSQAVIQFLNDTNSEASMDSQVDVAVHTLVQTAPPALYYHLKVVEQLLWDPWGQSSEAQYAMLLMVCTVQSSIVVALYTINTTHFNVDPNLFLGIMASHNFDAAEFQARDTKSGLPPPFGTGPPLGQSKTRNASSTQRLRPALRQDVTNERPRHGSDSASHTGPGASRYLARLEKTGSSLVQCRGLSQSLSRTYPFLLQNPEDLTLRDVEDLLEQYKNSVMRYEALKAGVANGHEKK